MTEPVPPLDAVANRRLTVEVDEGELLELLPRVRRQRADAHEVVLGAVAQDAPERDEASYTTADICLGSVPAMRGSEDWRQVGKIISAVSEHLYCAGWMQHAEYDVYRLMTEGGAWGAGTAAEVPEELGALRSLSRSYGVWVTWCHEHGEEPISLDQWEPIYKQWRAEWHAWHLERGQRDPHRYDDGADAIAGDLCVWCLRPKDAS